MISMLFLAAIAASAPVEARVTAIDLQRPVGAYDVWYNRISVELESAEDRRLRLCPSDVAVVTERRAGEGFAPVDRFRAHAMKLATARSQTSTCRNIVLAPGRPQVVTFIVAAVPGGRHRGEDRYTILLDGEAAAFRVGREEIRPAP